MKKKIAFILAVLMSFCVFPAVAEEDVPEAVYDNSLIVTLNSETQKTFALSDFDEALFADVKTVSKLKTESGFVYQVILTLKTPGNDSMEKAFETYEGKAGRNYLAKDYKTASAFAVFSDEILYVPVGETRNISVDSTYFDRNVTDIRGIDFTVDMSVYNENNMLGDTLVQQGVVRYYSNDSIMDNKTDPDKTEYGYCYLPDTSALSITSQYGNYYGDISADPLEVIDRLSALPGIISVSPVFNAEPPIVIDVMPSMTWTVEDQTVAETVPIEGLESELQTAVGIVGRKLGATTGSFCYKGSGFRIEDEFGVEVFVRGDVNADGQVSIDDALLTLQASVQKISLDRRQAAAAEIDSEQGITVSDALTVLQIAVNKAV